MTKGIVFGMGFLGTRIANEFYYENVGRNLVDPLNLHSLNAFLSDRRPDVVINAVGKTGKPNIDWCESHKEETLQSNVCAAINLSTECSLRDIYFVHLGSGGIYYGDNESKGFSEDDYPNFYGPQYYAKTKILAETALKELPGLILRIMMPIDNRPNEKNLIDKLRKYSKVVDVKNSMTAVPHMLSAMRILINNRKNGIYNLVNPGVISAAEIMSLYQEIVDQNHKFEVLSLENLDKITLGKRSNCFLNSDKLKSDGIFLPEIHDAVRECLQRYKDYL